MHESQMNGTFKNSALTGLITETLMSHFGCNSMNGPDTVSCHSVTHEP